MTPTAIGRSWQPVVAAALVILAGVALFQAMLLVRQHREIGLLAERTAQLRSASHELRTQQSATTQRAEAARQTLAQLTRADIDTDSEMELAAAAWLARVARMKQLAGERPELGIPECEVLTPEQWFAAAREAKLDSDEDIRSSFKKLHATARESLARLLLGAVRQFADAHEGNLPPAIAALADFLGRTFPAALLERFEVLQHGSLETTSKNDWILAERLAFAQQRDDRIYVTRAESGAEDLDQISERALRVAVRAFAATNSGRLPTEPAQLVTFLPDAPRRTALEHFLAQPKSEFNADKLKRLLSPD